MDDKMGNKTESGSDNRTERVFLEQMLSRIIRKERERIHKRLSSMTSKEFEDNWLDTLTPMFGLDNINDTIKKTARAKGITKDSSRYSSIVRATYQAYTIKGIAYFQELLAMNKQISDTSELSN